MRPRSRRAKQQANAITAQEFALCNGSDDSDDEKVEFVPGMDEADQSDNDHDDDEDLAKEEEGDEDAKQKSSASKTPAVNSSKARRWEPTETPKSIEGYLQLTTTDQSPNIGKMVYTDDSCYIFESTGSLPESWSLLNPATTSAALAESGSDAKPVLVWQWCQPSGATMVLDVQINSHKRKDWEKDALHQRMLKAQTDFVERRTHASSNSNGDAKQPAASSDKEPPQTIDEGDGDAKQPASTSETAPQKMPSKQGPSSSEEDVVYTLTARERASPDDKPTKLVEVSGVFLPPKSHDDIRVYILATIKLVPVEESASSASATAAGGGHPAAAVARKRRRGRDDHDDDSVGSGGAVDYSELIHLHEDAHMSTEELRRKYYGGGGGDVGGGGGGGETSSYTNSPQPKKKVKSTGLMLKKPPPSTDDDDDDDADDDNYGF